MDSALRLRKKLLFVVTDLNSGDGQRAIPALLAALDPQHYDIALLDLGPRGQALASPIPASVKRLRSRGGLVGARLATLWHGRDRDLLIAGQQAAASFCVHWAARLLHKPAAAWVHIAYEQWARDHSERHLKRSREAYREILNLVFVSESARISMRNWLSEQHALPSARQRANWTVIANLPNPSGTDHLPRELSQWDQFIESAIRSGPVGVPSHSHHG